MATSKNRINLSVPRDIDQALQRLAVRRDRSVATTALDLITQALELDEDTVLQRIATSRDRKGVRYVSHRNAWRGSLSTPHLNNLLAL